MGDAAHLAFQIRRSSLRLALAAALIAVMSHPRTAAEAPPSLKDADAAPKATATPEDLGLSRDDPWSSALITAPDAPPKPEDQPLARSRAATSAPVRTTGVSTQLPWSRSILALGGVLGLIALCTWGYRAVVGGSLVALPRRKRAAAIEVLSRAALSPRHSVCLLRVGDRAVLVGIAPQSLTTLDVVADPSAVAQLAGAALTERGAAEPAFGASLAAAALTHAESERSPHVAPNGSASQSIDRIRDRLTDTLARLRTSGERA